jgi:GNAT superfamily N-acetyltransferase
MLIRHATDQDRPAIMALVPRLVAFGPPPWRDALAMTKTDLAVMDEALRSTSDDPIVFVAEFEGNLAGLIHLRSVEDYYRRRSHGHVADLIVVEGCEGQGIATVLLAKAEEWARAKGYDWLGIAVFEANGRAEKLYEKFGFHREVIRMIKPL